MYLKKSYNKKVNKTQLSFVQGFRINGTVKHKVLENLGYAIPKAIYSKLGLRDFFQDRQRHLDIEYNLNSIFMLLVFNRFLFPSSKKNAYDTKGRFFESFDFSLDDLYRSLGYFSKYSNEIQKHLNDQVTSLIGRNTQLCYYDVTIYFFEISSEDEDIYDASNHKIQKLSRKRGPSKEHRKDPIIQMGLLMDANGIPIAFNTFSGNESEKLSLIPTVQRIKREYSTGRVVIVADRGLNTSDNTSILSGVNAGDKKNNDGYVYGQSIRGADKDFKKWVLEQEGYVTTKEKDSNGKRCLKMVIYQKQMVYYSEKYAKKQRYVILLSIIPAHILTKTTIFLTTGMKYYTR